MNRNMISRGIERVLTVIVSLFPVLYVAAQDNDSCRMESDIAPVSVGLVLSGGGAKGIAEIGVIQALEENNIPIDYIAGTSMGAIVGGLYASGLHTRRDDRTDTVARIFLLVDRPD